MKIKFYIGLILTFFSCITIAKEYDWVSMQEKDDLTGKMDFFFTIKKT